MSRFTEEEMNYIEKLIAAMVIKNDTNDQLKEIKRFLDKCIQKEREEIKSNKQDTNVYYYDPIAEITKLKEIMQNIDRTFLEANKEQSRYDLESEDLLHLIELCDLTDEQKITYIESLKKVRNERRKVKDFIALISPLQSFYKNNANFLKNLKSVEGSIKKEKSNMVNRKYQVRVRHELSEFFTKEEVS